MNCVQWKNVQYVDQKEESTWWIIQRPKRISECWHLKVIVIKKDLWYFDEKRKL